MMTFGNPVSVQKQTTDSLGRFDFNVHDKYGQNLNIVIQSAKKSGKKMDYTITLDKNESPAVTFNHVKSIEKADSVVHAFVEKNIERKIVDDAFPLSSGTIYIDEVTVEGYRMTPNRKKVMEKYGKPDQVIDGEAIREKEEKWSFGLYSVLMYNFPNEIEIIRVGGVLYAQVKNGGATFVVIDGIPVKLYDYPLIPNLPPSDVSSFEIIKYADNFLDLYFEVVPNPNPKIYPEFGSVIAIYTHGKLGLHGVKRPEGILHTAIPVFSTPREFYAPKYENLQPKDWHKPDLRALVHWEPRLIIDSLGKASATFYNADNIGEMQVLVEAISENGDIGYQEIVYKVKKRK